MEEEKPSKSAVYTPLVIFAVLLLVCLWRMPLTQSLWLDETVSFWVIKDGLGEVFERAVHFQGQSPFYYWLLGIWGSIFGTAELTLRLPSLLCGALSLILVSAIAKAWLKAPFAWIAALALLGQDSFLKTSFSARPYALSLCLSLAAVYALLVWLENGKKFWGLLFVLAFTGSYYAHYFAVVLLPVFLGLFITRQNSKVTKNEFTFVFCLMLLFLAPGLLQLKLLAGRRSELVFARLPDVKDLLLAALPPYMLVYIVGALLLACLQYKFSYAALDGLSQGRLKVLFLWYLLPLLGFFLFARLTGTALFVDRYILWYVPALALVLAYLASILKIREATLLLAGCFAVFMLIREGGRRWHVEDWKTAARIVNEELEDAPVFTFSGLVEGLSLKGGEDALLKSYLLGPFSYYQLKKPVELLPGRPLAPQSASYVSTVLAPKISPLKKLILVSPLQKDLERTQENEAFLHEAMLDYLQKNFGLEPTSIKEAGIIRVFQLTKN